MRIAAFILAILGGLAAAALGITWLDDLDKYKESLELAEQAGISFTSLRISAYLLLTGLLTGIAGGVLALQRKGKIAAAVLIGSATAPAILEPKALVFTFLLLVAGLLALGAKPKQPLPA